MQLQSTTAYGMKLSASSDTTALDIRCGYALATIFQNAGCARNNAIGLDDVFEWELAAEVLGYGSGPDDDVPALFVGTPLASLWANGHETRHEGSRQRGTQEEWDRLTDAQQGRQWESFHVLCAQGIGEDHHFYDLLMVRWLVGYGGH